MIVPKSPSPNRRKSKFVAMVRKVSARQAKDKKRDRKKPTLLHYYWPDFVARA